ncbi:MAG: hypothetical protein JXR96_05610 [Deltaproteobacteria bacterium]|nr:hypothetical protein [Deltaproteobacteria bacterium]
MSTRQAIWGLLIASCALWASSCGPGLHELYTRLPEQDKELFDRNRQFMTERQRSQFLELGQSADRVDFVESLRIQERLARFPAHIREAILAQRAIAGMDAEALLLAWGPPDRILRLKRSGIEEQHWLYRRPAADGPIRDQRVVFVAGVVTEILLSPGD